MTVGELIDKLSDVPLSADVFVAEWCEVTAVRYDSEGNDITLEIE